MLSTDSLVRELFLVCQLAIGYQLAKNQLASNRPIGNWCQLASNWPIGLDWQLAGRARFFWIGLAIGWPTKNYLSNWATLLIIPFYDIVKLNLNNLFKLDITFFEAQTWSAIIVII
jgi:hypothetical protein